jgi:hypothetical protein
MAEQLDSDPDILLPRFSAMAITQATTSPRTFPDEMFGMREERLIPSTITGSRGGRKKIYRKTSYEDRLNKLSQEVRGRGS